MTKIKIALLFAIIATTSGLLQAQKDLPSGQVDVVKNFEARLLETEKIALKPSLPQLDTATRRQKYDVIPKNLAVEYLPPKIRPLGMRNEAVEKGYNGYARLGAGFPGSFYGEGSYNIAQKNLDFGLNLLHHSANNTKKTENQRFSDNNFGINGAYYFDQGFAVGANLGYSRNSVYYYGYNDLNEELGTDFSFEPDEVKQRFSTFDAGLSIFNGVRNQGDLNYHAGFKLYNLNDNYAARETGFELDLNATKWFSEKHPLRIGLKTDLTSYRDTAKQSLNNFFLQPNFTFHGERFRAKIGVNIANSNDKFSFFPDVEVSANIIEGVVGAFIGAEGSLQKNDFRTLSEYNPYVSSRVNIKNTSYINYYGGVKGNISGIDYNAQVGYKQADDLALFLLNSQTDSIARFDVLYDTVDIFTLKASLNAPLFKGFEITGTVSQNVFSPKNEEKAWHLPALTVNVGAKYTTLEDKLTVRGEFFLENGVPYLNSNNEADNLNALFDVSVGADYFFTKNIGAFINIYNLANNRRQRWQRYPTFGLNALFGITARF